MSEKEIDNVSLMFAVHAVMMLIFTVGLAAGVFSFWVIVISVVAWVYCTLWLMSYNVSPKERRINNDNPEYPNEHSTRTN